MSAGGGNTGGSGGPFRLDNKSVLVTGAASGIGEQTARLFARQGARVAVADINAETGERVAAEIRRDGQRDALFVPLDVTDPDSVEAAFVRAEEAAGPLDILVNSAGISFVGDILQTTPADFDRLIAVNVRGVFLCSQAAVRRMKESGRGGCILNLASIASKVALADRFAYAATKGAVLMMTRALACDHVADNIRCNCVCPARVHTALVDAFLAGPYADVHPLAVEAPFQLVLAGTVVRGRIDAVYARPDGGFDVIDWKTSRRADADATQLALYRLAWAELSGVPLTSVGAAFYYVRTASVVRPDDLPDRVQLSEMLFGGDG